MIFSLLTIFYQDYKERMVDWRIYIVTTIGLITLHIDAIGLFQFGIHVVMNSIFVLLLIALLAIYIKIRIPNHKFTEAFAIGDVLFICMLALGFSTLSFITLFCFGVIFVLILDLVLKYIKGYSVFRKVPYSKIQEEYRGKGIISKEYTTPFAGYLALFFSGILIVYWLGFYDHLYLM